MKRLIYLIFVFLMTSCTKEEKPAITGTWKISKSWSGGSYAPFKYYDDKTTFYIEFLSDGELKITAASPESHTWVLGNFNRYRCIDDETIELFSSTSNESTLCAYEINGVLTVAYLYARCGARDVFVRSF